MKETKKICPWCYYARMRTDICGIYCTGGFENPDGTCDHFRDSKEGGSKKERRQEKEAKQDEHDAITD